MRKYTFTRSFEEKAETGMKKQRLIRLVTYRIWVAMGWKGDGMWAKDNIFLNIPVCTDLPFGIMLIFHISKIVTDFLKIWIYVWLHGLNVSTFLYNTIQIKKLNIQYMIKWHWNKVRAVEVYIILHITLYGYCNHCDNSYNNVPVWVLSNLVKPGLCLSDIVF